MMMVNYKQIQSMVEKLNLRERSIVLSALFMLIFVIWYMFWFVGVSLQKSEANSKYATLMVDEKNLTQQIQVLTEAISVDAHHGKKQQLVSLQQKQDNLDEELARLSQGLISAQRLSYLLQDVLQKAQTIELVEMSTLPVKSQLLSTENSSNTDAQEVAGVYQHGIEIVVRGSYFEISKLLVSLESLPWRFYWGSLVYDVSQYPKAQVKINVYTLSAEEGFLGV